MLEVMGRAAPEDAFCGVQYFAVGPERVGLVPAVIAGLDHAA
jgi:hypothetical protein